MTADYYGRKVNYCRRILFFVCTIYCCYSFKSFSVLTASEEGEFYKLLTSDNVFVDKSLFIEDYIRTESSVCRITRPDGWGKTTNLDMLRRFLEMEVDENGTRISEWSSINRKLFVDNNNNTNSRLIRKTLKISESDRMMTEHRGQYPVIYLSLNEVCGRNYVEVEDKLRRLIVDLFRKHSYVLNSRPLLCDIDARVEANSFRRGNIDRAQLSFGLAFLSDLLRKYFQRTVYILVDDYDRPVRSVLVGLVEQLKKCSNFTDDDEELLFAEAYKSDEFQRTNDLFKAMLKNSLNFADKTVDKPIRCLMTGVFDLDFAAAGSASMHYDATDTKFSQYFGFTESEVSELMTERNLSSEAMLGTIVDWYGYHYHSRPICNPRSISRWFSINRNHHGSDASFRIFWSENKDVAALGDYFLTSDRIQETLYTLLDGDVVRKFISSTIGRDSIVHPDRAFSYLTYSGHLIPIGYFYNERQLTVPNREMKNYVRGKVLKWLRLKTNMTALNILSVAGRLAVFDIDQFRRELTDLLIASSPFSLSPPSSATTVRCYDTIMKCVSLALEAEYDVRCNYRWGQQQARFANITLIAKPPPTSERRNAIIIDYKSIERPTEMQHEIEVGLHMMNQRMYDLTGERYPHIERILKIVLIFCGKRLAVDYQVDENY